MILPGVKVVGKIDLSIDIKKEKKKARKLTRLADLAGFKIKNESGKYYDHTKSGCGSKSLRAELYIAFSGKCCYCGRKTKLPDTKDGIISDDCATIEHVYNRLDIRRLLCKEVRLACSKCNKEKGIDDYDSVYNNGVYNDRDNMVFDLFTHGKFDLTLWQKIRKSIKNIVARFKLLTK